MRKPDLLKLTNKVGIISTARKISKKEIQPAINRLQQWGLEPILGKHLFSEHHQFAGTTDERAADLQEMLDNPEIKAILCARGGYGTVQIIDKVDFTKFMEQPKWVIGYSDVTVLHVIYNAIAKFRAFMQLCQSISQQLLETIPLPNPYTMLCFMAITNIE
jgi:muramoyltetrapeptide carboxypeptidase